MPRESVWGNVIGFTPVFRDRDDSILGLIDQITWSWNATGDFKRDRGWRAVARPSPSRPIHLFVARRNTAIVNGSIKDNWLFEGLSFLESVVSFCDTEHHLRNCGAQLAGIKDGNCDTTEQNKLFEEFAEQFVFWFKKSLLDGKGFIRWTIHLLNHPNTCSWISIFFFFDVLKSCLFIN